MKEGGKMVHKNFKTIEERKESDHLANGDHFDD